MPRRSNLFRVRSPLAMALLLTSASVASAHEPIRGFGPNTLWKGGISGAVEVEESTSGPLLEHDHEVRDPTHSHTHSTAIKLELLYGLTANVQLSARARAAYDETHSSGRIGLYETRFEGVELGAKWRFFKDNEIGRSWQMAVDLTVLAKGDGSGATPSLGFAVSRDSLTLFLWGDVRASADTSTETHPTVAGLLNGDMAVGVHAWTVEYGEPDLVLLLEGNTSFETARRARDGSSSGGFVQAISPGFLFFYDFLELKGSIQVPVYEYARGTHYGKGLSGLFSVEVHY